MILSPSAIVAHPAGTLLAEPPASPLADAVQMIVRYGSYTHRIGEMGIAHTREMLRNEANVVYAWRERFVCNGMLLSRSTSRPYADISLQARQLTAAYSYDGRDFSISLPDGSASAYTVRNADTLSGTRVTKPSFALDKPAAGTTHLYFTVTVEFEVPAVGASALLLSFNETLSFTGGGPATGHIECLTGKPVKQTLRQHTIYRATQSGSAVGFLSEPIVPPPIWPNAEIRPARQINEIGPKRQGGGSNKVHTEFGVQWTYQFEDANALNGRPNKWLRG